MQNCCTKKSKIAAKGGILHFTSNKNVKFWQHFWAENILKVPTNGKGIPDNNLIPYKWSILRENTYEIWIRIVKRQKKKKKMWNVMG